MLTIKKELLEALNNSSPKNIALYFCGTINQCFILKTLLQETNHNILIYYFDKTKYQLDNIDYKAEQENLIKILKHHKKQYRNFSFCEIVITKGKVTNISNLDNPLFHIELFRKAHPESSKFNSHIITNDYSFFKDQLKTLKLYSQIEKQAPNITIIAPFQNFKPQEITKEALSGYLGRNDLNVSKIYNDNKNFLEALKSFDDSKDKQEDTLDKFITTQTSYDIIHKYLLSGSTIAASTNFLKKYGHLVSKDLHIETLSHILSISFLQEELIDLSVSKGDISDDELNQILLNKVNFLNSNKKAINKERIDEIDCFFRLYSQKINEETKDKLMINTYGWRGHYDHSLLEKLIDWKCDVGELLLRVMDDFATDIKESKALILLENYRNKIHPLQLHEALLKAYKSKLYNLCNKLIQAGADKKVLQFHSSCYANDLFCQTRTADIKTGRKYWRTKDRVIIAEILKELKNPQTKVPPVIHVTGSNGKGSVCHFLKSILEENSYKIHMLTSPATIRSNENYIISGKEMSDEVYYAYLKRTEAAFNNIKNRDDFKKKIADANKQDNLTPEQIKEDGHCDWSFIIPSMILAFSENKADITIVEVVTGGEFDVTNFFDEKTTIATIINNIIFGDGHANMDPFKSIEGAANTKSRLSKNNIPIFSSQQEDSVARIIKKTADERNCPLFIIDEDFAVDNYDEDHFIYKGFGKEWKLQKPTLLGDIQIDNASLALSSLLQNKKLKLTKTNTQNGIRKCNMANKLQVGKKNNILKKSLLNNIRPLSDWCKGAEALKYSYDSFKDLSNKNKSVVIRLDKFLREGSMGIQFKGTDQIIFLSKEVSPNAKTINSIRSNNNLAALKKYYSSTIAYVDNHTYKKEERDLLIFTTREDNYIALLCHEELALNQPNFQENLEFAKKHNLLDDQQISFLSGSR